MKRFSDLERKYVLDVIDNEFNTSKNSIYNNKLEKLFAEKFSANYAIGHSNGTVTMHTALAALGVVAGDEVIVPPLTMSSTSLAVLNNGSIPVYADVDIDTFNIDADAIEKVITPKTKAVITVALYGLSPDYDKIINVCKKHNLFLKFTIEQKAKNEKYDVILVDTAGRLQNKFNLMEELKKIKTVIDKQAPEALRESILVIDANTGQNGLQQAKVFSESVNLTCVALTKLDGSAKGAIIIAIAKEMKLPVKLVGVGEKMEDLKAFNPDDFIEALFS